MVPSQIAVQRFLTDIHLDSYQSRLLRLQLGPCVENFTMFPTFFAFRSSDESAFGATCDSLPRCERRCPT